MLREFQVSGFKSLSDVKFSLPRLTVLFGPNAAGKSNVLDAIQALSRVGTLRTLSDALSEPIRGYPIEAFAFPRGGLPQLLSLERASFELSADVALGREAFRYRVGVEIQPASGMLRISDEFLAQLGARGDPKGSPAIEKVSDRLRIRRKSKPAHPREESLGLNHSILSDPRLGGVEYRALERVRQELSGWKVYYLDPRVAMRSARPPEAVNDIGLLGEHLAPFLYRLRAESSRDYDSVVRTVKTLIPAVESIDVDLDPKRGTLDINVRQDGIDFSSRIVSEGTLRVLALCAIAANPWGGSLIGFEEPENGVHPRRLQLIASLLWNVAHSDSGRERQLVVTTHSPLFCDALLRLQREEGQDFALMSARRQGGRTVVAPFPYTGPLFNDREIAAALSDSSEDALFDRLIRRGLVDA